MGRRAKRGSNGQGSIGGDFWASYSDLMAGLLLVFMFISTYAFAAVRELIEEPTEDLRRWHRALLDLCKDPQLIALNVQPDCTTGQIELTDSVFFEFNSSNLKPAGKERLRKALPIILRRLRSDDLIERRLDAIEIRGHSDWVAPPDDPYGRNLGVSQRRAFEVLHFLATDPGIPESDRELLRKKGLASGAADQRPAPCNTTDDGCRSQWRRVEIHFELDDSRYRKELYDLLRRALETLDHG